jgi:hypothetical protein
MEEAAGGLPVAVGLTQKALKDRLHNMREGAGIRAGTQNDAFAVRAVTATR